MVREIVIRKLVQFYANQYYLNYQKHNFNLCSNPECMNLYNHKDHDYSYARSQNKTYTCTIDYFNKFHISAQPCNILYLLVIKRPVRNYNFQVEKFQFGYSVKIKLVCYFENIMHHLLAKRALRTTGPNKVSKMLRYPRSYL